MQVAQQAFQSFRRMFLVRGIIAVVFGVLALVLSPGITRTSTSSGHVEPRCPRMICDQARITT